MMTRRKLLIALGAGALLAPLSADAQPARKLPRVGMLLTGSPSDADPMVAAFRQGLRDLGYVEGQNIAITPRWADIVSRLPILATELVESKVDIFVTQGTQAAQAAKKATSTIPIVMATSGNPVEIGLVASLARPGGNITGHSIQTIDTSGKQLELLKQIVPGVSRISVVSFPTNPANPLAIRATEAAAKKLGLALQVLEVRDIDGFERVFQAATRERARAVFVSTDPLATARLTQIADLAIKSRLPTTYGFSAFAESGGLVSYGPNLSEMFRGAATYVDKILKGAKPGDLPVEQPTKFELVLNQKTAKAMGIKFSQTILVRADRVIE